MVMALQPGDAIRERRMRAEQAAQKLCRALSGATMHSAEVDGEISMGIRLL